eukprot:1504483-Rhodomonas_salina.1
MSGTDIAYATTMTGISLRACMLRHVRVCCYRPLRASYAVLSSRISLRAWYEVRGTERAYGATANLRNSLGAAKDARSVY